MRQLPLRGLDLSGGASRVEVTLPRPVGTVPVRISGGASRLTLHRPAQVAARIRVSHGVSKLTFDRQRFGGLGGDNQWESPDYQNAADRYDIEVSGGASNLTIDTW